jgi:hypothetical protein
LGRLAAVPEPEVFMQRTVEYRGFEIHVDLLSTSEDMFDVWFRIEGPIKPPGVAALGERIKIRGGPFSVAGPISLRRSPARPLLM